MRRARSHIKDTRAHNYKTISKRYIMQQLKKKQKHVDLVLVRLLSLPVVIGRKEGSVLFIDELKHILFTDIWRQAYAKGPLK